MTDGLQLIKTSNAHDVTSSSVSFSNTEVSVQMAFRMCSFTGVEQNSPYKQNKTDQKQTMFKVDHGWLVSMNRIN